MAPKGRIAQLVEQLTLNQRVVGSSPTAPTMAETTPQYDEVLPRRGDMATQRPWRWSGLVSVRASRHAAHGSQHCRLAGADHGLHAGIEGAGAGAGPDEEGGKQHQLTHRKSPVQARPA